MSTAADAPPEPLPDVVLGHVPGRRFSLAVPVKRRTGAFTVALILFVFVAGWTAGLESHAQVINRTRTIHLTPKQAVAKMTAAEIVKAWGKPDSTQAGPSGTTCFVYQSRRVVICG